MHEILPIASGLMLGGLVAATRISRLLRLLLIVTFGACATVASGEFKLSWGFLAPDTLAVALAAAATFFVLRARGLRPASANQR